MEAALEVFASEGYHRASISKISSHAGISKGLIYNYFNSKEELLMETLIDGTERIREVFKRIEDELDTPEELKIYIKGSIDLMKQDEQYYKTYFSVLFQPEAYLAVKENYEMVLGGLMKDVAFYFEKKGDKYPMEKAFVLGALLDGVGLHYLMAPELYDLEKIEEIIFELFR